MKPYIFQNNQLTLNVKKSPFVIRFIFFFISFLFFLLPIFGMTLNLIDGNGFNIFSLFLFGAFWLAGFYMLRISLWNTYGKEIINFELQRVVYEADYGWFKGAKKEIAGQDLSYAIQPNHYEENKGVLVFQSANVTIESVVQIPIAELEELLIQIREISYLS